MSGPTKTCGAAGGSRQDGTPCRMKVANGRCFHHRGELEEEEIRQCSICLRTFCAPPLECKGSVALGAAPGADDEETRWSDALELNTACGHRFHEDCLATWFGSTANEPTCPLCRKDCASDVVGFGSMLGSTASLALPTSHNAAGPASGVYPHRLEVPPVSLKGGQVLLVKPDPEALIQPALWQYDLRAPTVCNLGPTFLPVYALRPSSGGATPQMFHGSPVGAIDAYTRAVLLEAPRSLADGPDMHRVACHVLEAYPASVIAGASGFQVYRETLEGEIPACPRLLFERVAGDMFLRMNAAAPGYPSSLNTLAHDLFVEACTVAAMTAEGGGAADSNAVSADMVSNLWVVEAASSSLAQMALNCAAERYGLKESLDPRPAFGALSAHDPPLDDGARWCEQVFLIASNRVFLG